ncbi:hypothetical protein C5167_003795 [Papaver somniferum]|uniref:Uncharacterized protein n=1 Tax=Papaver somniferum TaxID=3469 RepID=A0A4Y7L1Z5_PAPSO|nr:hypothetical protein C5167_003795 [Papaver somniferum]
MRLFSGVFSEYPDAVNNPALSRTLNVVVKIFHAPSTSHESLRGISFVMGPDFPGSLVFLVLIHNLREKLRVSEAIRQNDEGELSVYAKEILRLLTRLHEAKEEIKDLKAKRGAFITEKDPAILKGTHALNEFKDALLSAQIERDQVISIDNARTDLAVRDSLEIDHDDTVKAILSEKEGVWKGHLQQIDDLTKEPGSLKLKLSARDSKYHRLKKKLMVFVSNIWKKTLCQLNERFQANADAICTRYNLPLLKFNLHVVPPNTEERYISSSEEEYEEGESYREIEEEPEDLSHGPIENDGDA